MLKMGIIENMGRIVSDDLLWLFEVETEVCTAYTSNSFVERKKPSLRITDEACSAYYDLNKI